MTQLTPNFSLAELTFSETAVRRGLDNTPDAEALDNLYTLAAGLEQVRALLGHPIFVSSGYRSPKVNSAVGSAPTSDHVKGYAADFTCPGYGTPLQICRAIRDSEIPYGQLINEQGWAHISFAPQWNKSVLTAHFGNGRTTYTQGLA